MKGVRLFFLSSLAVCVAAVAGAQTVTQAISVPVQPKVVDFGTSGYSSVRIPAWDFSTLAGGAYAWPGGGIGRYPTVGTFMEAAVHVPGGAKITRLEFDFCDTNATSHMAMTLARCDNVGAGCTAVTAPLATTNVGGCDFVSVSGLSETVDNYNNMYELEVSFGAHDGTNSLTGAIITYQLQVSPAPGSATFGDVPTSDPGFQYIEALAASGITAGCAGGNYCPDSPLTRRQMAVFLAKALGLHWNYN